MPFTDRFTTIDGRRVAYVDEGDGPPLVLVHGGAFDHAELTWRPAVAALRGERRVIVPDLPGYGASAPLGGPEPLPRLGAWLGRFLGAVNVEDADIAGLSLGGGMALWLALAHPARVRRLVLVGPYGIQPRLPLHPLAFAAARLGALRAGYRLAARSRLLARVGLSANFARRDRLAPALVAELRAVAADQAGRLTFRRFLDAELGAWRLATDLRPRLQDVVAPTLLIQGRADLLVPVRHARRAARAIPDARLIEMDTGHWPMRERPAAFLAHLRTFLGDANRPRTGKIPCRDPS